MITQPYLFFDGRCDEALEFYKKAVGAKIEMRMQYKDAPDQSMVKPESKDKVMHACLKIGDTAVMASDGHCNNKPDFKGFALSLSVANPAEAKKVFAALGEGGQITMPLNQTFFAESFGMLTDRFGVGWMVMAGPKM